MQLHLDGTNSINATSEKVFRLLTDTGFLAKTLPDAEDVRVIDETHLEAKIRVRVAVVSSKLKAKMSIASVDPPSKAELQVEATGSGSNIAIKSTFVLAGSSPTTMKWAADAEITGVMAGLGSTLLRGFATKKVAEIFEGITRAIESTASQG
ncbi:MAG: SRPBCC family protein [Thaumarchaeota archaeon]|nr:SRPBCC family protein [Nitrososphaerota archaeon]